MIITMMPNRKKLTVTNETVFGEFSVWDIIGKPGCVITFRGQFYDTRSTRKGAEWCAANFKPDHAERHLAYLDRASK